MHLREPGREEAETIETGSRAAALGGFTAIVAMPNTDPTQDSRRGGRLRPPPGRARRAVRGAARPDRITVGRAGEQLAPFAELAAAGVQLFTDDGNGVQDPLLMRRALEYADGLGITLAQHCEVDRLTAGAVMHEGDCCSRLGLPGWPSIAEELMVHRDIELVAPHRCADAPPAPVDRRQRRAGARGQGRRPAGHGRGDAPPLQPHRRTARRRTTRVYKVNPPLRTADDIAAINAGLADGTIDAIATDHAPHAPETKEQPLDQAPPGMLGLETALGVALARCSTCRWPT